MKLYPAIDLIDGACVRLVQGNYKKKTLFSEDPVSVAKRWDTEGADMIHLVDLDGAKSGIMPNFDVVCSIAKAVSVPVEVGGGIRDMEAVKRYLDNGIYRVILGTSALKDFNFTQEAVRLYGDRIAVGIDAKDGAVAVNGWEEVSSTSALSLAKRMEQIGVSAIIYTDIATDGMLQGPNIPAMREMAEYVSLDVVASGGVTSLNDIKRLSQTGVSGVIIGKALYTGAISLKDAKELCNEL